MDLSGRTSVIAFTLSITLLLGTGIAPPAGPSIGPRERNASPSVEGLSPVAVPGPRLSAPWGLGELSYAPFRGPAESRGGSLSIPVGRGPTVPGLDPYSGGVYVPNNAASSLSIIDPVTESVQSTLGIGTEPYWAPEFDPANGDMYVPNQDSNDVTVVNGSTDAVVATVPVGGVPWWPIYDPADTNNTLYVSNSEGGNLTVIDGNDDTTIASIPIGANPWWPVIDPEDNHIFVPGPGSSVTVVNGSSNRVIDVIGQVGNALPGVFDPENGDIYIPDESADEVSIISGASDMVIGLLPTGSGPVLPTYDPLNGNIYVPALAGANVTVISGATNSVVTNIPVGAGAEPPILDPVTGDLYVAGTASNSVTVISGTTNSVINSIPVGSVPYWPVFDPLSNAFYVPNTGGSNVSVIPGGCAPGPTICYVSVGLSAGPLLVNHTVELQARVNCTGGPCPKGLQYAWTVTGGLAHDGSNSSEATVNLTAGAVPGEVSVGVQVDLAGVEVNSTPLPIAIVEPYVPPLTGVALSPRDIVLGLGQSINLTARAECGRVPCPSSLTLRWSANQSVGMLNSTSGSLVEYTAGGQPGEVALTVSATLNGVTVNRSGTIEVSRTPPPELSSVSINPAADVMGEVGAATFVALYQCTGGAECPLEPSFDWSMNRSLGVLNVTGPAQAVFHAVNLTGNLTLSVTASLDGRSATGSSLIEVSRADIPVLHNISVLPNSTRLEVGHSVDLDAITECLPSVCLSGTTYEWTDSEVLLASLNDSISPDVELTAGQIAGTVTLFVEATLNNATVASSTVTVTIWAPPNPASSYLVVGAVIAAAAGVALIAVVWYLQVKRRKENEKTKPTVGSLAPLAEEPPLPAAEPKIGT